MAESLIPKSVKVQRDYANISPTQFAFTASDNGICSVQISADSNVSYCYIYDSTTNTPVGFSNTTNGTGYGMCFPIFKNHYYDIKGYSNAQIMYRTISYF